MRVYWMALLLIGCGEDEPEPEACALTWSGTTPVVPSCEDIDGRIREVSVARWRDEFTQQPQDSFFVSQSHCDEHADGSLDAPYCWVDDAITAAVQLDHASIYLDPGQYSIMGEAACGDTGGGDLNMSIIGAGAATTRLHVTCDLAAGEWAYSDLSLAAETVTVPAGSKLTLERVFEENLAGNSFLDVQGEIVMTDVVIDLETPEGGGEEPDTMAQSLVVHSITGKTWESEVALRLAEGASGLGSGVCISQAQSAGLLVTGEGTRLSLSDSVVEHTRTNDGGYLGYGIAVEQGASLTAAGLLLDDNVSVGLLVHDGASASLEASRLQTSHLGYQPGTGVGLVVQEDASASIASCLVTDNEGPGVAVSTGADLTVTDSEITSNLYLGLMVQGASLDVSGSRIAANWLGAPGSGGGGVFAYDVLEDHPLDVTITGTVFEEHAVQVYIRGEGGSGEGLFEGNRLGQVYTAQFSVASATLLNTSDPFALEANCFEGGDQLLLHEGTASLDGNQYAPVTDAVTIRQQSCDGVDLVDTSLELLPDPDGLAICDGFSVLLEPLMEHWFDIVEAEAIE